VTGREKWPARVKTASLVLVTLFVKYPRYPDAVFYRCLRCCSFGVGVGWWCCMLRCFQMLCTLRCKEHDSATILSPKRPCCVLLYRRRLRSQQVQASSSNMVFVCSVHTGTQCVEGVQSKSCTCVRAAIQVVQEDGWPQKRYTVCGRCAI
jgi:hypothetical protein